MAKKYYAVRKGLMPGVYDSWDECKSQVHGFPGAEYKSFSTLEEAKNFVQEEKNSGAVFLPEEEAIAYVDGSYQVITGEYSCGVVFLYQGEELHFAKKGEEEELAQMRNVAGEIMGAALAMEEAVNRGVKKLTIYHDYQGIASWCKGEWKTNKEGTKAYKAYYDSLQEVLEIHFVKVKGHSGDKYNDLADELAKSALG